MFVSIGSLDQEFVDICFILQCEMVINFNCSTRFEGQKEAAVAVRSTALLEAVKKQGIYIDKKNVLLFSIFSA